MFQLNNWLSMSKSDTENLKGETNIQDETSFHLVIDPVFIKNALHLEEIRPIVRINLGGCGTPKNWTFLNLTPLRLLQKPHFWPILWLNVDLLADLGGASHPCNPPPTMGLKETFFHTQTDI